MTGREAGGAGSKVLVVDDSVTARTAIAAMLRTMPEVSEVLEAGSGREGLEVARDQRPAAVLMDIHMRGMDGIDTTARLVAECPKIPVIGYSASLEVDDVRALLEAGATGYTVKSAEPEELRIGVRAALQGRGVLSSAVVRPLIDHYVELIDESRKVHRSVIESLAAAVEAKDVVTSLHLHRVSELAVELASKVDSGLGKTDEFLFGCLLHDVGKIGVPEAILSKPAALTPEEWEAMRLHPVTGMRVIEPLNLGSTALEIVLHHHERWDGEGYPMGLRRTEIPLAARIFSVCDALDAMTSDRPYRQALPLETALDRIREESGHQFDPTVVAVLIAAAEEGSISLSGTNGFLEP